MALRSPISIVLVNAVVNASTVLTNLVDLATKFNTANRAFNTEYMAGVTSATLMINLTAKSGSPVGSIVSISVSEDGGTTRRVIQYISPVSLAANATVDGIDIIKGFGFADSIGLDLAAAPTLDGSNFITAKVTLNLAWD